MLVVFCQWSSYVKDLFINQRGKLRGLGPHCLHWAPKNRGTKKHTLNSWGLFGWPYSSSLQKANTKPTEFTGIPELSLQDPTFPTLKIQPNTNANELWRPQSLKRPPPRPFPTHTKIRPVSLFGDRTRESRGPLASGPPSALCRSKASSAFEIA